MHDLTKMTAEDFRAYQDQEFLISSIDPQLALTLVEVREMGQGSREGGAYSVLFQSDLEEALPQMIYRVTHADIGENDIFLVPVAKQTAGVQYEAVFT